MSILNVNLFPKNKIYSKIDSRFNWTHFNLCHIWENKKLNKKKDNDFHEKINMHCSE